MISFIADNLIHGFIFTASVVGVLVFIACAVALGHLIYDAYLDRRDRNGSG